MSEFSLLTPEEEKELEEYEKQMSNFKEVYLDFNEKDKKNLKKWIKMHEELKKDMDKPSMYSYLESEIKEAQGELNKQEKHIKKTKMFDSKEEIIKNKKIIKKNHNPTIYFLINELDEIVYVGQSLNSETRVRSHLKDKEFSYYSTFTCEEEEMNDIETFYILRLKPKYNGSVPPNTKYISKPQLKKWLNTHSKIPYSGHGVNRFLKEKKIKPFEEFKGINYFLIKDLKQALSYNEKKGDLNE